MSRVLSSAPDVRAAEFPVNCACQHLQAAELLALLLICMHWCPDGSFHDHWPDPSDPHSMSSTFALGARTKDFCSILRILCSGHVILSSIIIMICNNRCGSNKCDAIAVSTSQHAWSSTSALTQVLLKMPTGAHGEDRFVCYGERMSRKQPLVVPAVDLSMPTSRYPFSYDLHNTESCKLDGHGLKLNRQRSHCRSIFSGKPFHL